MQVNCPQCGNRIVIDDAKVPDRPFKVKCRKCQGVVSLPGKGAAAPPAAASPTAPEPLPAPAPQAFAAAVGSDEMRAQVMAQVRREMVLGGARVTPGRALVALPDSGQAGAVTLTLTRLGYPVDTLADAEEGARLLEQGAFSLVATARTAAPGKGETFYQRTCRLGPDARRRVFLVLVGDDLKTGDGTEAWAALADLVVNSRDAPSMDGVLHNALFERARLYQAYLDARRRFEEAAG